MGENCLGVVHDFTGFMTKPIKEFMKEIVDMLKNKNVGKGFRDVDLGEIQERIDTTSEEVTEHDLMEMSVSESVPDNEEKDVKEAVPEKKLILDNPAEAFQLFKTDLISFTIWTLL